MSNEIMAISELVKKCKILLLDIEGTTTSISFVKDKLFPYAEDNVKQFLDKQWESEEVKEAVVSLRKLSEEDKQNTVDGVVEIPGEDAAKDEQIEGLVGNVKWQMSKDRKSGALKLLQGLIWKQGYDNGDIKGHVYDDVSSAMEQWRSVEGQKIYIYSSGSIQAQKLLFGQSTAGNLLPLIDGHFDTAVGPKREAASYTAIAEKIGCKPDDILFLTDIVEEAEAAKSAGVHSALVDREGGVVSTVFPVITSMAQLVAAQKRKTDEQNDEPASKVAKTETKVEEKPAEKISEITTEAQKSEEPEKMEVEDTSETSVDVKEKKLEPVVETIVEEITDSNEANNAPLVNTEPVITEAKVDDTENKMETDNVENATTAEMKSVKVVDNQTEITEIEEISSEKPISEGAEDVNIKPIVEEPALTAEDVKAAGDELEKECSDMLTLLEDVTKSNNILLKPAFNSVAEETTKAETTDSTNKVKDGETEIKTNESSTAEENSAEQTEKKEEENPCDVPDEIPVQEVKDSESEIKTLETITEVKKSEVKTKADTTENESTESPGDKPVKVPVETKSENDKTDHVENNSEVVADKTEQESEETEKKTNGSQSGDIKELVVDSKDDVNKSADVKEPHVNGNATNGDTAELNGDNKVEELNDRLTENKTEAVNGSNGKVDETAEGNGDSMAEAELTEIKVKSVPAVEERNEPQEQATEA